MRLKDVAKRAGVSTATVSRVLNSLDVVKSSTRTKVMKAIAELNYHPNLHARTLAGGKSRILGMIVSNLENPFFFDIFQSLEEQALLHGLEVFLINTGYEPERLSRAVRAMIGRRVAGLAMIVSETDPLLIRELQDARIPAVFYDVGVAGRNISSIRVDYRSGVERIVDYLRHLGHRRFAYVGHHSGLAPTSEREQTFLAAVARYAPETTGVTAADEDSLDGGRRAAQRLLNGKTRPTAIICVNDMMAAGVLRALREHGLRVPQDVSVTGFDNIRLASYCEPPLTTAHIPREQIGRLVFEALTGCEETDNGPQLDMVIEPELVVRQSTGPAPVV